MNTNTDNNGEDLFDILRQTDLSPFTKRDYKGLTYLSWAKAWEIAKTIDPDMAAELVRGDNGMPYHTDGLTCWVEVRVTLKGRTESEILPVRDSAQNILYLWSTGLKPAATMKEVCNTIKRCFVKCMALHGLGLYIYDKEDVPTASDIRIEQARQDKESLGAAKKELSDLIQRAASRSELNALFKDGRYAALFKDKRLYDLAVEKGSSLPAEQ